MLIGHEDSVYSIHWQPLTLTSDASSVVPAFTQPLCLLSSSMDKTMVVWSPDSSTGLWVEQVTALYTFYDLVCMMSLRPSVCLYVCYSLL